MGLIFTCLFRRSALWVLVASSVLYSGWYEYYPSESARPWFHYGISQAATLSAYNLSKKIFSSAPQWKIHAASVSLGIAPGLIKESYDYFTAGTFDKTDMWHNALGVFTGLSLIVIF